MYHWRNIKTAPKDGRSILIYDYVEDKITTAYWQHNYWKLLCPGPYADDATCYPSHWQPLPEKPKPNRR